MSESQKVKKRRLKAPDAFQKWGLDVVRWCSANQLVLVAVSVGILLVMGGGFGFSYYKKVQMEKRIEVLGVIDGELQKRALAFSEKQTALQGQIQQARTRLTEKKKGEKAAKAGENSSKTLAQLEEQLEKSKLDAQGLAERYVAFFKENSQNPEGKRSAVSAVTLMVEEKKYVEAAEILKDLFVQKDLEFFYAFQIRSYYISVLEELGKFDEAMQQAEELVNAADTQTMPHALLTKGRVHHFLGQKEAALEVFDKLIQEHNSAPESQKAQAFKAIL